MFLVAAMVFSAQLDPEAPPMRVNSEVSPEFQFWGGPFSSVPSTSDARAAFPLKLRATTSSVALNCIVSDQERITSCEVRLADPDLPRPKAAALKLLRYFRAASASPGSKITIVMQFSGKVWRCLMPFCMPDLIQPPPVPARSRKPAVPRPAPQSGS